MGFYKSVQGVYIGPAEVLSANEDDRVLSIRWLSRPSKVQNVLVVNDPTSYSLPKRGDIGLVISTGGHAYFVGKLEYGYKEKIYGKKLEKDKRVTDGDGNKIYARKVNPGETLLSNIVNGVSLFIGNSGGYSLLSRIGDGLTYSASDRYASLSAKALRFIGQEVTAAFGKVMRNLGAGLQVIPNPTNPLTPAVESMITVASNALNLARVHLGHVMNPLGIFEFSSFGGRLRALLEACDVLGISSSSIKMDEIGNLEMSSATSPTTAATGKTLVDSGNPINSVLLGGLLATQHAVFGEALLNWLNMHTHPTSVGPTSIPVVPADPLSLLSKKVMVG